MARLAHEHGSARRDPAAIYETLNESPCVYRECEKPRVIDSGEVYDFCITHLLRIDRKIGLAPGVLESLAKITTPDTKRPDVKSPGVVYFMLIGDEVKIGFTTDLKQRAANLKADQVLGYFPGDRNAETTAHQAFAQWRTHGEYFAATPECLAAIWRLTNTKAAA